MSLFSSRIWTTLHCDISMAEAGEKGSALRGLPWPQVGSPEHAVNWYREIPPTARGPHRQGRHGAGEGFITYMEFYGLQLRACGHSSMIIQNSSCKALECTVLWQQDFLPNSILGSEHTLINLCKKVCWGIRGGLVLGTIHRPPTEWKVHTWIIESWLSWRQKSGCPALWARR